MNRRHGMALLLLSAAIVVAPQARAADACKNVKFRITNSHVEGREIEIRRIEYRNPHAGGVRSEEVKNLVCKHGVTCTTAGDDLANAQNVDLADIKVVFRHKEADGDWSDEYITQPFQPAYRKCVRDKLYGPIVVRDSR